MVIKAGDPLILKDAKGLKKFGLVKGMKGTCNGVTVFEQGEEYVSFMPDGAHKIFVVDSGRFIIDNERLIQLEKEEDPSSNA